MQFAQIDARKAEEARRKEKPVLINEWEDGKPSPLEQEKNLRNLVDDDNDDDFEEDDEELDSPKPLSTQEP